MDRLNSPPSARSSSPPSAACTSLSLLELPPEIRNNIYELVLTRPDSVLRYVPRDVAASRSYDLPNKELDAPATKPHSSAYNNLQLVCKALHQETHLLELKYIKLCFTSYMPSVRASFEASSSATCTFFTFFANIPADKRIWVRNVELQSGIPPPNGLHFSAFYPTYDEKETLCQLASLCRRNPEMNVKYRLAAFSRDADENKLPLMAVIRGILFKNLLRNEQVDLTLLPANSQPLMDIFDEFDAWWGGDSGGGVTWRAKIANNLQTPNLRFYPMEDVWEDGTLKTDGSGRSILGRHGLLLWEPLVKSWLRKDFKSWNDDHR